MAKRYDHIVLGTGQSTGTLLGKLIPEGGRIAVIEGNEIGGSCVNYGCTPTKTMVATAKAIFQARRGDFFGFQSGEIKPDFKRIMERMNEIRHGSRDGLTDWIESTENVELIRGWGTFVNDHTIGVGDQELQGGYIYINVGTSPVAPPITGLEYVPWMDSARLLELTELPTHLLIIGGGYIGMEFAQVFRRFGSEVTVVQRGSQLMPHEDEDVAKAIQEFLEKEGIRFHLNASAKAVTQNGDSISLEVEDGAGTQTLEGSHLLIAAGRKPNTKDLGLENTEIQINERGYIMVDDHCQTNVENVYAVGDVNGRGAFTHTSVNDAEIVLDHMSGGNRALSKRNEIYGLFTDPPLGRVGLTEKAALEKGHKVLRAIKPMAEISRAKEMGETHGFAKLLVDADTDQVIGAAILGPGGDEVVNMIAAVMHSGLPCRRYREMVLPHPTVSELMPWVLDGLEEVE